MAWTPARTKQLIAMWQSNWSPNVMARVLEVPVTAVFGKIYRLANNVATRKKMIEASEMREHLMIRDKGYSLPDHLATVDFILMVRGNLRRDEQERKSA